MSNRADRISGWRGRYYALSPGSSANRYATSSVKRIFGTNNDTIVDRVDRQQTGLAAMPCRPAR